MKNFHEKQIYIVLAVVHIKYTIVFVFCKVLEKYIYRLICVVLFLVVESSTFLGVKFFKHGVYTSPCRHAPKAPVAFRARPPVQVLHVHVFHYSIRHTPPRTFDNLATICYT